MSERAGPGSPSSGSTTCRSRGDPQGRARHYVAAPPYSPPSARPWTCAARSGLRERPSRSASDGSTPTRKVDETHDQDGDQEGVLAADEVAEAAEHQRAERADEEARREGQEGEDVGVGSNAEKNWRRSLRPKNRKGRSRTIRRRCPEKKAKMTFFSSLVMGRTCLPAVADAMLILMPPQTCFSCRF